MKSLRDAMAISGLFSEKTMLWSALQPFVPKAPGDQKEPDQPILLYSVAAGFLQTMQTNPSYLSHYLFTKCQSDLDRALDEEGKSVAGLAAYRCMSIRRGNKMMSVNELKFVELWLVVMASAVLPSLVPQLMTWNTDWRANFGGETSPLQFSNGFSLKEGAMNGTIRLRIKLNRVFLDAMKAVFATHQGIQTAIRNGFELFYSFTNLRLSQFVNPATGNKDLVAFTSQNHLTMQGATQMLVLGYINPGQAGEDETIISFNPPVSVSPPVNSM